MFIEGNKCECGLITVVGGHWDNQEELQVGRTTRVVWSG